VSDAHPDGILRGQPEDSLRIRPFSSGAGTGRGGPAAKTEPGAPPRAYLRGLGTTASVGGPYRNRAGLEAS